MTWFDWRLDHWGTCRAASGLEIMGRGSVSFATEGSTPIEALAKVSGANPGIPLRVSWDGGGNRGSITFLDGMRV